jgi:hypothetical protein
MQDANKMQHQIILEKLFAKNQLIDRLRYEFFHNKSPDFVGYMEAVQIDMNFGLDLLIQMQLHKRCSLQVLLGTLRGHYETAQEVADAILKCAEAYLVDFDPALEVFIVKFLVNANVQEELDRYQYPLPMVVEPEEVTNNKSTGYKTIPGSLILKKNHHNDDICLDHINRMNKVKLTLDADTAMMVKNQWKGLDKMKDGDTKEKFEKRKKAFALYDKVAKDVIGLLTQEGNEFYLTHAYDKRGRTYCKGYHVNYQGNPWNKAVIQFADKELID